ncbi:hypothetical protein M8J75_004477 [Diaphorina citri]|nr:hypothetical protein M8J75_004477 [Diaphorina citri]
MTLFVLESGYNLQSYFAGVVVDVVLYPLDTIKTRLQSQYGFWRSGGFKAIYKGLGPAAISSPIQGGVFFLTYDGIKTFNSKYLNGHANLQLPLPLVHIMSASCAEAITCVVRVPTEIIKQRRQASMKNKTAFNIVYSAIQQEGIRGMFRGYTSTVLRDIPFSVIQFPIWEYSMKSYTSYTGNTCSPIVVAGCGALSGGIAAALTCPLDVAKTQIMLASENLPLSVAMKNIYTNTGLSGLFAGFLPRITFIMLGGAIFFGVFEQSCRLIED